MLSCTGPLPSAARLSRPLPLAIDFVTPWNDLPSFRVGPTTPSQHRRQAVPLRRFRLFPFRSPLLRESLLLSFPRGTEMFQFPRFPPTALCVQAGVTGHDPSRVSPFGYPRIKAWSAAPRGFSQPPTSFIGIWRQGIHRWLFIAWDFSSVLAVARTRCSCSLCSSQPADEVDGRPRAAVDELRSELDGSDRRCREEHGRTPARGRRRGRAPSKRNSEDQTTTGPGGAVPAALEELNASEGRHGVGMDRGADVASARRRSFPIVGTRSPSIGQWSP